MTFGYPPPTERGVHVTNPREGATSLRSGTQHLPYRTSPAISEPSFERLSPRQREILALVAEEFANDQIARLLDLSEQTVKFHLSCIYRKLNLKGRTALITAQAERDADSCQ